MMIRRAILDDVPALVALAKQEHAKSLWADTPFDDGVSAANFSACISGLMSVVFVSCDEGGVVGGLIAGIAQQNLHNRFHTAYELLWYSVDGAGLKLLDALKDWANRMRATALVAHNYAGIVEAARFNRVMARKGMAPLGASYMTRLEN